MTGFAHFVLLFGFAAGPADARVRSVRWGERFARVEVCKVRLEPRASLFRGFMAGRGRAQAAARMRGRVRATGGN